jgi:hypothetical protein
MTINSDTFWAGLTYLGLAILVLLFLFWGKMKKRGAWG